MPVYLEVIVNVPRVSGVFHYQVPAELEGGINAGHLVLVPFGKQSVQGVVVRQVPEPAVAEVRSISALVDPQVVLTGAQIELAQHLAKSTLATLSACIYLMLPAGLSQMADTLYQLKYPPIDNHTMNEPVKKPATTWRGEFSKTQLRLLELLHQRGPLRGRQIERALPRLKWENSMRSLVRQGLVTTQSFLPAPTIRPKAIRTVQLAGTPETSAASLASLGKAGGSALKRRQAVLELLMRIPGQVNTAWVYAETGCSLADLHYLAERNLVILGASEIWRDPLSALPVAYLPPPELTKDQKAVFSAIQAQFLATQAGRANPPILLHGVTGSGKTEIYLQAVDMVLQRGKQAIILVPEIALTPQTVRRFVSRFPGKVGLLHSGLSMGERYDTWRRARLGELQVVVGPRSALFTPFGRLGLIVVDECHDDTYYQSDIQPHYHARKAAIAYARMTGALCLLGSATPDIESQYYATRGDWQYLSLPTRILAHREAVQAQLSAIAIHSQVSQQAGRAIETTSPKEPGPFTSRFRPLEELAEAAELPPVQVVDMRQELKEGNLSIFSRALQNSLNEVLNQGQQAILFLNRRGTATYVFCRDCGYRLDCPRCQLPLTYHSPNSALICHYCYYTRQMPKRCPQCRGSRIRQYGTGTERVQMEVERLFPQARTLRWDYETTRQKGAHDLILSQFSSQLANVLIGTQMLAKGLDLPLVTLVGVVLADVGLNLPDYRAAERTFQVLTQVAGRAGRSPLGGQVILQTFQPEHYVIQAAARHDYQAFYNQELAYRQQLGYPPFTRLVRLEYRHSNASQAESAAREMATQVNAWLLSGERRATRMIGPVPCFFSRLNSLYRWQIILLGPDPASLFAGRIFPDWRIEVDPPDLL